MKHTIRFSVKSRKVAYELESEHTSGAQERQRETGVHDPLRRNTSIHRLPVNCHNSPATPQGDTQGINDLRSKKSRQPIHKERVAALDNALEMKQGPQQDALWYAPVYRISGSMFEIRAQQQR